MRCELVKHKNGMICVNCKWIVPKFVAGLIRNCRAPSGSRSGTHASCIHRVRHLRTYRPDWITCGHDAVQVYHCDHHGRPVTLRPVAFPRVDDARLAECNTTRDQVTRDAVDWIRDELRTYRGETCKGCRHRRQTPAVHNSVSLRRFAVATCHFDPHSSASRLANYRRFAAGLAGHGLELHTIVARFDDQDPPPIDGPNVRHVTVRDSLWHKERLLNLLIRDLPAEVDAVGWFDADVMFQMRTAQPFAQAILAALNRSPVIQPWNLGEWLDASGRFIPWGGRCQRYAKSMAAKNWQRKTPNTRPSWAHPGFAWAIRRETFDQVGGLFDEHPIGGGDAMMAIGIWGQWGSKYLHQYNAPMRSAALDWGRRVWHRVRGDVGYVDAICSHLWHGSLKNRRYSTRNRDLSRLGIDPRIHLATAANGTLCWSATCPAEIRQFVADYFAGRCEDGGA